MKNKKNKFLNSIRGWLPKETRGHHSNGILFSFTPIEQKRAQDKEAKTSLIFGSLFVLALFSTIILFLGSYRPLWFLMLSGAIIGLCFGAVFGVGSARFLVSAKQKKPYHFWGLLVICVILFGVFFTSFFSYILWLDGVIDAGLFLPLINGSIGFAASFFIADGSTRIWLSSHR